MKTMVGTIKRLVKDKGFGFVAAQSGEEYFFHSSACSNVRFDELREGQSITFDAGEGPKGPRAENIRADAGRMHFDVVRVNGSISRLPITLNLPGIHYVQNALAAIAVATEVGVDDASIGQEEIGASRRHLAEPDDRADNPVVDRGKTCMRTAARP